MSRVKYFTRTVKSKEVTATLINPGSHELSTITLNVPNGVDVKDYIDGKTNNILVSIDQEIDLEDVYKMDLETFMANAVKLTNKGDYKCEDSVQE